MKIGQRGIDLIKSFESLRLEAYQDSVGVWTMGYGSTLGVKPGDVITEDQANTLLAAELLSTQQVVSAAMPKARQSEFDAVCALAFNVGNNAIKNSTLLQRHNTGFRLEAAREFVKWDHAGGKELLGLLRRRFAEGTLYLAD